jgi:hypothetical protein
VPGLRERLTAAADGADGADGHDLTVVHRFPRIGERAMTLSIRRIDTLGEAAGALLLALQDGAQPTAH